MKFKRLVVGLVAFSSTLVFAQDLLTKHQALGIKSEPSEAMCLSCHGQTYQALAESTKKITPNPHDSHMGEVQCDACHQWQGKSRLMCSDCHSFPQLEKGLKP